MATVRNIIFYFFLNPFSFRGSKNLFWIKFSFNNICDHLNDILFSSKIKVRLCRNLENGM